MYDLLIKLPSRGRCENLRASILTHLRLAVGNVGVMVTLDIDDDSGSHLMICEYSHIHNLHVFFMGGIGKVSAINGYLTNYECPKWKNLLISSDDMTPLVYGYDKILTDAIEKEFPDGDGTIRIPFNPNSPYDIMPCMGHKYFDRFGYVYNPEYKSLCCDVEYDETARKLGRQFKLAQVLFKHERPNAVGEYRDGTYVRNDSFFSKDQETFKKRNPEYSKA